MKTQTKIAASLAMLLSPGLASAVPTIPLTINVGVAGVPAHDYGAGGDAGKVTGTFTEIAFNEFLATSLYEKTGGLYNGTIRDTNSVPVLTGLGIPTAGLVLPAYAQTTNGNLSPLTPPFGALNGDNEGFGMTWGLVTAYDLTGTIPTDGTNFTGVPSFTSGTWDIYFDSYYAADGGIGGGLPYSPNSPNYGYDAKVLSLTLTGSELELTNITLNFTLAYALPGFLSIDGVDAATVLGTKLALDAGINPPIPYPGSLQTVTDGANTYGARQTTMDGSIATLRSVPEPSSVALLGLGLMGFAAVRRKNNE